VIEYMIWFLDVLLLLSVLFKHYLVDKLWIVGSIIPVIFFIINIIITVILLIKNKNKTVLIKAFVIIISVLLYLNNADEKIALNIELKNAKKTMEKIIENDDIKVKNSYFSEGFFVYGFLSGVTDNHVEIIYDNSGFLENGINIIKNNTRYLDSEEYGEIKILFGGDLYYIKKLDENWYLCYFT